MSAQKQEAGDGYSVKGQSAELFWAKLKVFFADSSAFVCLSSRKGDGLSTHSARLLASTVN